jgi:Fe2+ or Zn2+ uptake regulation protein
LRDAELVREVVLPHADAAVYEPMSPPHAHFHCTVCGRIDDVPYTLPAAVIDEIRSLSGNEIVAEHLTLEGVCEKCG